MIGLSLYTQSAHAAGRHSIATCMMQADMKIAKTCSACSAVVMLMAFGQTRSNAIVQTGHIQATRLMTRFPTMLAASTITNSAVP